MRLYKHRVKATVSALLLLVYAVLLLVYAVGGCASTTDGLDQLMVRQQDRILKRFELQQLRGLPQVEVATPQSNGAQVQKGPTVRSVLNAAGVTNLDRIRVEGRDPAQTLTAGEITDQVILNVTKRNTLKLTGTQLPRDRWVRDVRALVVDP